MDRIDPAARCELMWAGRHEIRCAETQSAATGISVDHATKPFVGPAQKQSCTIAISGLEPLADFGAGDGEFVLDVGGDVHHIESVGFAAGPQQVHIALPTGTEPVVVADHHRGDTEPVHEDVADEICRLEPGELSVEGLNDEMVKSGSSEGGRTLVEGLEQLQATIVSKEHLSRVGIEGEHHRFCTFCCGSADHPAEEGLVPQVHTIEGARGDDAPDAWREMGKTVVDVHCTQR